MVHRRLPGPWFDQSDPAHWTALREAGRAGRAALPSDVLVSFEKGARLRGCAIRVQKQVPHGSNHWFS